ncbi:MAG: cytochrome ubiquinol oxidase subunit I [Thermoleophilaceae bacterium]|nr:cytochrome ubiquinol oxidase subunit I [Thermoleophilaceae bacterium]
MLNHLSSLLPIAEVAQTTGKLGGGETDQLVWARQLQALSLVFHIPLVCFGIAFPTMVLFTEGLYLRTGDLHYKRLAKRWSKVIIIFFAVGVVTGTILTFEFGILWPNFMATFGDVFGLGFGLEGFAFFTEAIFVAIYVYGWDRLPKKVHFWSGVPMAVAGVIGATMILAVNGWMNDPKGFDVVNNQIVNINPWRALFNDFFWHELAHMYLAGYVVVGFLVASVYAVAWLRGDRSRYVRTAMIIPLTFAALVAPVQVIVGDWAAREVATDQPVKLAAMEGLGKTQEGAPFTIGGLYDKDTNQVEGGVAIPKMLSLLAFHDPNATVEGLDSVPADDRPGPVNTVRYSFHVMVGIGTLLALLGAWFVFAWWRKRSLPETKWFYRAVAVSGVLAVIALEAGWIVTEVGRQPWIAYNVMRVADAVTQADGISVLYGFGIVVYIGLAAMVAWLLRRLAKNAEHLKEDQPESEVSS